MYSRFTSYSSSSLFKGTGDRLRKSVLTVFSLLTLLMISHSGAFAQDDVVKGQQLFVGNCARCHATDLRIDATGPALYNLMERVPSREWLYPWIKNSAAVIASGDEYAVDIWEKWNKSQMSAMPHLTDDDIGNIVSWIEAWEIPVDEASDIAGVMALSDDPTLSNLRGLAVLLGLAVLGLLGLIGVQVAKLRGIDFFGGANWDKINARLFLIFLILGLIGAFWSSGFYSDFYLFDNAASEHGQEIDTLFWVTMTVIFGTAVLTNAILFLFAYLYGKDGGRKARFYPDNNRLEMIWTVVPAITLTILIIFGIRTWNHTMMPPDPTEATQLIEISGEQWGWTLRYPGPDGELGDVDVRRITGVNGLGVDMSQKVSQDDFISNDLVIKKGERVDLKIRSRDVLHSVYLPHFRVKMDAVPGMDTRFHFMPLYSTKEYREILKNNSFWGQFDSVRTYEAERVEIVNGEEVTLTETVVDSVFRYESFDFELACTEVCGRGHWSMAKKVIVLEPEEYDRWHDSISEFNLQAQIPYDASEDFPNFKGNLTQENSSGNGQMPILD